MKIAVFPGSFDPITNGHLDVLTRVAPIFDAVVVAVLQNVNKRPLFTLEERLAMIRAAVQGLPTVRVDSFAGLLVDFARDVGAVAVIRGIRSAGDCTMEVQMANMNRRLQPQLTTLLVPAAAEYAFVSSSLVKEVAGHGSDVTGLVPSSVGLALSAKFGPA